MDARSADLARRLAALVPADELETSYVARFLQMLAGAGDPFSRDHFDPGHVTASAFVLSPEADAILLIEHSKLHRWLQPGGHVDPTDDHVLAAAQREVAEEAGLPDLPSVLGDALLDVDIHEIPARKQDPAHFHFDVRFLLQAPTTAFAAGSDAKAARWVPLDAVQEAESDASVMRAVAKIRAWRHAAG